MLPKLPLYFKGIITMWLQQVVKQNQKQTLLMITGKSMYCMYNLTLNAIFLPKKITFD